MIQPNWGSRNPLAIIAVALAVFPAGAHAQAPASFRPPAVPLIAHDPYFSVWSTEDRPTDGWSRHWTGAIQAMCGLARVDGKAFRLLGTAPDGVPAMEMTGRQVTPTRTIYSFAAGGTSVTLTFTSPLLPHDLDLVSRPATYLDWSVRSTDGKEHHVALYFDATGEFVVNTPDQQVKWDRSSAGPLDVLRIGSAQQPVLGKAGDNLRIDWGHLYVTAPKQPGTSSVVASDRAARDGFASAGTFPAEDDSHQPRAARDAWPVLAFAFDLGSVGKDHVDRHLIVAYDQISAIEYFHKQLPPYWRRNGRDATGMLQDAEKEHDKLVQACRDFDSSLRADLEALGGPHYAELGALAYRQTLAAHVLVAGPDGRPLYFSKENFSNGCIATVDVTYPSSPFFLLFNPTLLRGQLVPVMDYARSGRWSFPFAPHDLGTYPKANGQVYGGGEKSERDQMPVEECGNMLIMVAALAKAEGSPDFAREYWPLLETWARYLKDKGLDPENQLCTDDFAGHLAHNTNLSLKAIVALGGFAQLCEQTGKAADAESYKKTAKEMAERWVKMAADGDHYRLAFDKPGTWSQKYNLVWDKILNLGLFPESVARDEVAFYLKKQNAYGLPLDNREAYTKLDWVVWTATLTENKRDFEAFVDPVYRFAERTPNRVPLTDWYGTIDAKQRGFQARSVVGGIYIPFLAHADLWKKWRAPH